MTLSVRHFLLAALTLFLLPLSVQAAVPVERDILIKGEGSAVYYFAADGKRYVFPNEGTYSSWYGDFSDITALSAGELASIPLGGNVTYRPGVKMVKITTDPKVYAVGKNGTLRWLTSEAVAAALYGPDWNTRIDDVPDAFFVNYSLGEPIASLQDYQVVPERDAAVNISFDKSLSSGTQPVAPEPTPPVAPTEPEIQNFVIHVSGEELPSTVLVNGTTVLARIKVTAGPGAEIAVKSIVWTVNKSSAVGLAATNGSSVREVGQGGNIAGDAGTVAGDCSAGAGNSCQMQTVFASEQGIAPGNSKTFELRMTANAVTSGQAVTAYVMADSGVVTGQLTNDGLADGDSVSGTRYNFIWSDFAGIPHNDTVGGSADWTNGFLVKDLPTDAKSLFVN